MPKTDRLDPRALARRQIALDRDRVAHVPALFRRKVARMSASPLGFLRGSAPLFYELLREQPDLAAGPDGEGWLVGDAHVENFGAFRPRCPSPDEGDEPEDVAFDLNDFDEAVVGPLRLDVLRLTTSVLLGAREFRCDGRRALALCDGLLENYERALFDAAPAHAQPPRPVVALKAKVAGRNRKALVAERTELREGRLRFARGERYLDLEPRLFARVDQAVGRYFDNLDAAERPAAKSRDLLDAAFRVAGTGSLGVLRIAVLLRIKDGAPPFVFDLKEQRAPAPSPLAPPPPGLDPAERVLSAAHHCLDHPPRRMAVTALDHVALFGRQLTPQEDKLALPRIADADLEPLIGHLGALLGRAHRRGATRPPTARWSKDELDALLDQAVRLAALHESTYLWFCRYAPAEADALP
jgi:uncharacterized protein (DUF2252 family)